MFEVHKVGKMEVLCGQLGNHTGAGAEQTASGPKDRQSQEYLKQCLTAMCPRKGIRQQDPCTLPFFCHSIRAGSKFPCPHLQTHHYLSSLSFPQPPSPNCFAEYRINLHVRLIWCPFADHPAPTLCVKYLFFASGHRGGRQLATMNLQLTALEPLHTVLFLAQGFCLISILVITLVALLVPQASRDTWICVSKHKLSPWDPIPQDKYFWSRFLLDRIWGHLCIKLLISGSILFKMLSLDPLA